MPKLHFLLAAMFACAATMIADEYNMRLVDKLDRPKDSYCLDILGNGKRSHIRTDMPLMAHNCKHGIFPDELVEFRNDGSIYFKEYDMCVTVAGVNEYVTEGTGLMLRKCADMTPFVNGEYMQEFVHRKDGKIQHKNSKKCIVVGIESAPTYTDEHRWRSLYMEDCAKSPKNRSTWEFVKILSSQVNNQ